MTQHCLNKFIVLKIQLQLCFYISRDVIVENKTIGTIRRVYIYIYTLYVCEWVSIYIYVCIYINSSLGKYNLDHYNYSESNSKNESQENQTQNDFYVYNPMIKCHMKRKISVFFN